MPTSQLPVLRRCLTAWTAGIVAFGLISPGVGRAGEEATAKRVENRGAAGDSTARPAGPKPGSADSAPVESKKECEVVRTVVEETTTVEQTQVVQTEPIVVVEPVPVPSGPPDVLIFEEVLLNTLGRRKVTSVVASTDPRNPIPSYAFVGLQPPPGEQVPYRTVRLRHFECDLEAPADWNPADSVFTLAVGTTLLQFTGEASEVPRTRPVADVMNGRLYPVTLEVTRRITAPGVDRYRLSVHFQNAALGHAPPLRPDDGVYVSVDPAPSAPPRYGVVKFVLVGGNEGTESSLRLVEKTGSAVAILPEMSRLELAASCSVVYFVPR